MLDKKSYKKSWWVGRVGKDYCVKRRAIDSSRLGGDANRLFPSTTETSPWIRQEGPDIEEVKCQLFPPLLS